MATRYTATRLLGGAANSVFAEAEDDCRDETGVGALRKDQLHQIFMQHFAHVGRELLRNDHCRDRDVLLLHRTQDVEPAAIAEHEIEHQCAECSVGDRGHAGGNVSRAFHDDVVFRERIPELPDRGGIVVDDEDARGHASGQGKNVARTQLRDAIHSLFRKGVRMFKRLGNLIRGFFGLFVSDMEKRNPEALLEVEKENLRKQIANYNQGLAAHAGLCERLMTQIRKLETEERELRAKAAANLRAGNRDVAANYALRLQTVQRELGENRAQLEQAETTYKELIKARDVSVRAAQAKIESLKSSLDDLKIKKATAELTEMASGMITSIGGSGDTLDRLHNMVEEEREKAAGRARVARDSLNTTEFSVKEEEQKALAEQALADFAAKEGLAIEPASGTSTPVSEPVKTMGPEGSAQ